MLLSISLRFEALVPGLGLKINEKELIKFILSNNLRVSLKSFSVSPG